MVGGLEKQGRGLCQDGSHPCARTAWLGSGGSTMGEGGTLCAVHLPQGSRGSQAAGRSTW